MAKAKAKTNKTTKSKPTKASASAKAAAKATVSAKATASAKATNGKHAAPTKIAPPSGDRVELSMLASRPHLADRMRDAFRSQCSDVQAEILGGRTKAVGVLAEARKVCAIVEHTLEHLRPGQVVRYSGDRLTWLLECVVELADTLASEGGRASAAGEAAGTLAVAEQRARTRRNEILSAMEMIADGSDVLEHELSTARGASSTARELVDSLRAVADLGTRWATSFDPNLHALAESVSLTRADLNAALSAADALAAAIGGKATAAPRPKNDSATVNRIEGRVLFELGKAMAGMNEAAARGIGQRIAAGPATAAVLARRASSAPKVAPPNEAGATPAG